jgi:GT2 family glycosyltransferase
VRRISVIIPAWNGRQYLQVCLDALLAQNCPDTEVIVVDNASSDGTAEFVSTNYPQVLVIRNRGNLGFAGGCNVGLRAAHGDTLALLNQDTAVSSGWLQAMDAALQNPKVGIVGSRIYYPDGQTLQHAGGWISWPLGEAHHYCQREQATAEVSTSRPVEFVTGAAMAIRRDVLDSVGLLDQDFWPGYFEDVDLCFRARKANYEVWYIAEATLTHVEAGSQASQASLWQAYHRGRLRFVLKHLSPIQFLSQFIQAEEDYHSGMTGALGSQLLCNAYLRAISRAPAILRQCWQADSATISEVSRALASLYSSAWRKGWQQAEGPAESEAITSALVSTTEQESPLNEGMTIPKLRELEFQSDIRVIGPLISRLRALWYGVAAKWAARYLMQQQDMINRTFGHRFSEFEHRLAENAEENALLAQEIARLRLESHEDTADLGNSE